MRVAEEARRSGGNGGNITIAQNQTAATTPDSERDVGLLLAIAIFFLPIIFAWFTLRKGHSVVARIIAFVWLFFWLAAFGELPPDEGGAE